MKKIINILEEIRPDIDFKRSTDFIDNGILDSLDIVALVSDLEEVYSILIDGTDIIPENFNSLEAIKKLVVGYGEAI